MNFIEQLTAVALLVDFFLGLTLGVVWGAVHGSLSEDNSRSLLREAPDGLSAGARVIFGLYTRDDGYMASLLPGGRPVRGNNPDERLGGDSGAQGTDPER
jgi:hypothetical protein